MDLLAAGNTASPVVVEGELSIELRDREVRLHPGELFVVPRGVDHRPVARGEVHVLLFEPASTVNTGTAPGTLTVDDPRRI